MSVKTGSIKILYSLKLTKSEECPSQVICGVLKSFKSGFKKDNLKEGMAFLSKDNNTSKFL